MNLKKQRRPGRQLPRGSLIVKYILVLLIAVVLPFAGVLFAVSAKATAMERSRTLENFDESLKIISLSIDNTLSSAETLHSSLLLDDTFQSTLKSLPPISRTPEFTELQTVRTIKSTLSRIAVRDRMIRNIYLYCPDVHRLFLSDSTSADYKPTDVSNTGWFTDFTRQDGTNRWVLTTALEDDTPLVCSYRLMPGAMLSINLSAQRVADILAETNPYEAVSCFLLDAYGTVLLPTLPIKRWYRPSARSLTRSRQAAGPASSIRGRPSTAGCGPRRIPASAWSCAPIRRPAAPFPAAFSSCSSGMCSTQSCSSRWPSF